jgi:hypothetical protein
VFWALRLVKGMHTRIIENSVKHVQGVHLNYVLSSEKSMLGGHIRTRLNLRRKSARESTPELLNTLRRKLYKECNE